MTAYPAQTAIDIEAELSAPGAKAQLVHYHFAEPPSGMLQLNRRFRVELCLTARHRSARACFPDHWSPHRFERIGDLFLIGPTTDVIARADENTPLTSILCEFDAEPVLALFDRPQDETEQHRLAMLDIHSARLRNMLLRLAEEARHPDFASGLMVDLIVREMAVEMFRGSIGFGAEEARGGLAPRHLSLIDKRLKDLREAPTLYELAELCRMSVRQLTRGFRTSRGCSIGAYVADSQMEHARRLLAADESVTAIAQLLGFSSNSSFCYAFRRAMGVTPGRYRQNLLRH